VFAICSNAVRFVTITLSSIRSCAVCLEMSSDADSRNLLRWRAQVTRAVMLWALLHGKDINRLVEFGTDVNSRLIGGNTFLTVAAVSGQTESVKALIRGGADINAQQDDGKSPLNVASWRGFTDIG